VRQVGSPGKKGVFSYPWEHKPDPAGVWIDKMLADTTEIYLPAKKLFGTDRPKIVGSGARCEYSDRPAKLGEVPRSTRRTSVTASPVVDGWIERARGAERVVLGAIGVGRAFVVIRMAKEPSHAIKTSIEASAGRTHMVAAFAVLPTLGGHADVAHAPVCPGELGAIAGTRFVRLAVGVDMAMGVPRAKRRHGLALGGACCRCDAMQFGTEHAFIRGPVPVTSKRPIRECNQREHSYLQTFHHGLLITS
jgi:hypothetical protein